ncbi:hypothetical protein DXG01_016355 [Tephrocybe rancida]|nr:hypothetical protein DXG01_016355 [Tephrocybe rancida]
MSPVQLPDEDDDIYSYFNKSVSAVQMHADHFEQEYARPALRASQAFFDQRPIAATFVAVFVLLSAVPVLTFLGLALFAVTLFVIIALTSTVILSSMVVFSLLSLLILTLLITLASAAFLTLSGISIYVFASFLNLVRIHGSPGVALWMDQVSNILFGPAPAQHSPQTALDGRLLAASDDADWSDTEDNPDQQEIETKQEPAETPHSIHDPLLNEKIESETALLG